MRTQLRNSGIYKLPNDQRSVYAISAGDGTYFLYDLELGGQLPPRFKVSEDGKLYNWFRDQPIWTIEDLIDTGENL